MYGIAQQWQGHVEFESIPGQGSEFRVWLPAQAGAAESTRHDEPGSGPRGKETVLLAEDEPQVRRLVSTVLEHAGYAVLVAEDGLDALSIAENAQKLDVLLSDVRMPRLGGVQLACRLRDSWPGLKVLLMSGYPDVDAAVLNENGFGDLLIPKPFTTSELLERLRGVLDEAANELAAVPLAMGG